jgi:glycosyltransferase involved in cell wall biosynthesis
MYTASGHGGVSRTVTLLANELSRDHPVDLYSVVRRSPTPRFPVDPSITVHWLVDYRKPGRRPKEERPDEAELRERSRLEAEPSEIGPGSDGYVDHILKDRLSRLEPGILITTRPILHLAAVRWAPPHVTIVAQDHLNYHSRMSSEGIVRLLDEAVPQVDAFVVLTEGDRADYERRYPDATIVRIPNASPFHRGDKALLNSKVVVTGGRLEEQKGFDRLIEAWSPIAGEFPDWQLHIYGSGSLAGALKEQIATAGLTGHVVMKGHSREFDRVLAGAALYAMGSRYEGFPMVLLEAMSRGLPMISFDCPRGPAEIIRDGHNGRLVADNDVPAFTQALRDLLGDASTRRSMGDAAFADAESFEIERVGRQWEELFATFA